MHGLVRSDPDVEVVWRAFELRPDPVPALDPKGEYLKRAWEDSVYPLAKRLGIPMRLPPLQPRSRLAHQAAHWARTQGRFAEMHAVIFRAFFERGEDIGAIAVLVSLAAAAGLDGEALRLALERRQCEESVFADERDAEALGVRAVPAFIADRKAALSGVQTLEALRALVDRARAMKG